MHTYVKKLLLSIFGEKSKNVRDNSLKVPHGGEGIVQDVKVFRREDCPWKSEKFFRIIS